VEPCPARFDLGALFGTQKRQPLLQTCVFPLLAAVLLAKNGYLLTDLITKPIGMYDLLHEAEGDHGDKRPAQCHTRQAQTVQSRAGQEAALFPSAQIAWSVGKNIVGVVERDILVCNFRAAGVHG
jgi:hypothetical protein